MSGESREAQPISDIVTGSTGDDEPKKIPKGVVLGKDGKPCRSCTSFSAWAAMTKDRARKDVEAGKPRQSAASVSRSDCPPDVETLGRGTWTLLHSIAATYPNTPSKSQQSNLLSFMKLFSELYPCWVCAEDFQTYLGKEVPRVQSRDAFGNWLCGAHNEVNRKLGKPEFDCSKWQQRWGTGWEDGRCD